MTDEFWSSLAECRRFESWYRRCTHHEFPLTFLEMCASSRHACTWHRSCDELHNLNNRYSKGALENENLSFSGNRSGADLVCMALPIAALVFLWIECRCTVLCQRIGRSNRRHAPSPGAIHRASGGAHITNCEAQKKGYMGPQVFRIQHGLDQRWYVSSLGSKVHSFPTQVEAEQFAKRWAKANQPSIVRMEVEGQIVSEWRFGDETPGIEWQSQK